MPELVEVEELEEELEEETAEDQSPLALLKKYDEADNICDLIDDAKIGALADRVIQEMDIDKTSRGKWDETMNEAMDLALQVKSEKTFPWPGAANVKYPLLTTAAIQFNARAYPAIVPGKDIVKVKINGDDSGMYEVVLGPDGQPQIDPETGQPVTKELVAPGAKQERADRVGRHMSWQLGDQMEEWESETDRLLVVLPIIGVVFRKTYYDATAERNRSELVLPNMLYVDYNATSLDNAPRITQEFTLYPHEITERIRSDTYKEFEFSTKSDDHDAPHVFYEQHRLIDLDEDGYPEPYIVTIHEETKTICRIVARFDQIETDGDKILKIKPIHYFTKYGFIPNPESAIYDLGLGTLLNPINDAVNTVLNQMLDAGTLQSAGGGFIGRGLRIKGGSLKFRPGEFKPVDVSGGKIAENLYHMQHPGPSSVLLQLLGLLLDSGKEIASIKDVLTGDSAGANASPTTTIAMIEQGLKAFTAIFKRVHRSLKSELSKIYKLNREYLPQEEYFQFQDEQEAIAKDDYAEDYDVQPVSDPTVVTDMQKMAKAQGLLEWKGDPFINQMEIRQRYFDAAGYDNVDGLLQEPSPPPEDPNIKIKAMELELKGLVTEKKLPAEIAELMSRAMKNIADAEAKESGTQIDGYKALVEAMVDENQKESISGMAGKPGNGDLPAVPI